MMPFVISISNNALICNFIYILFILGQERLVEQVAIDMDSYLPNYVSILIRHTKKTVL